MRRMIPENQQEALRKLVSKEALLGLMTLGSNSGIDAMSFAKDSDGFTYVHISGSAVLTEGDGSEHFQLLNIPKGLRTVRHYVATNDNGGGGSVKVLIDGTKATFTFNDGAIGRAVYFSALLSKVTLDI